MVGKLKDVVGIPIASTQAGAYMRPFWYNLNFEGRDMTQVLLNNTSKTMYEDALKLVFHEQELAGLDIFTDGGLRYDDWIGGTGWMVHLVGRLGGVKWNNEFSTTILPASQFLQDALYQWTKGAEIVEKLTPGNLQMEEFFKFAKRFTDSPLRYTTPEACVTAFRLGNKANVYKDKTELYFDICKLINQELKRLVDAGCKIIQLDYPFFPEFSQESPATAETWRTHVEGFNSEVQGVNAQIWIHVDWGRPVGQIGRGHLGSFIELFKHIAEAKIDVIGMEAASTFGENLETELPLWKEYCSEMDICIGGVNHRRTQVETPEEVAGVIKKALKYVPPERLAVYNDCGMSHLPRAVAYGKLKAIVEGCKLVRNELGIGLNALD